MTAHHRIVHGVPINTSSPGLNTPPPSGDTSIYPPPITPVFTSTLVWIMFFPTPVTTVTTLPPSPPHEPTPPPHNSASGVISTPCTPRPPEPPTPSPDPPDRFPPDAPD